MALTNSAINSCRSEISSASKEIDAAVTSIDNFNKSVRSNQNYFVFMNFTQIGQSIDEKFNKLFSALNSLRDTFSELNFKTSDFLSQQEHLNEQRVE